MEVSVCVFSTFVSPDKPVVSFTISGWLKIVLRKAEVNIGTFKAHSTRSASTSKADLDGSPIGEILKRGYWLTSGIGI